MVDDQFEPARNAIERGEWSRALEVLDELGDEARLPAGLELRAAACYGDGQLEACVSAWEDLHAMALAADDEPEAARAAAMVAMYLMMDTGLMAPVRGWLTTAQRLAEGHQQAPAHALIAMVRTYERFMCGDMATAGAEAQRSIELGERLDVVPAVVIGRVAAARITILEGRLDEGLDQLDEVGALLMSGQVDALTTGMMYCELICAAQGLGMHDRAAEWTEVMERWRHDAAFGGINGRCRVHRAEILRRTGPTDAAEAEALGACDELRPWMRREFGWPMTELGNIRLRRGDLDGAEEAFLAAHEHAWCPHPGLALVRLARGDVAAATDLIDEAIRHPVKVPSKERPPFGDLYLAPLLSAQVEIACVAGDVIVGRSAAEKLSVIAERYQRSPYIAADAALARARVALLSGELDDAITESGEAVASLTSLGAPYETAMARTVLGSAHDRAGDHEVARMEWRAAAKELDTYGAAAEAQRVRSLVEDHRAPPAPSGGVRRAVFALEGDHRRIVFDRTEVLARDLKGFRYLERMLADPGREFHVLDLVAVDSGSPARAPTMGHDEADSTVRGNAGLPVIDDEAREAYRRRLAEVDQDIEIARADNDVVRCELAEKDRDFLIEELKRAVGLGGRLRSTGGDAERARGSVGRCLRYAIDCFDEELPALADHLRVSLRTGTYCSYSPDPLVAVDWEI